MKRRGSAALYVMVMLVIMTTVTLAYASLSNAAYVSETRREQAVEAKLAFDGATLKAAYDAGLAKISIPSTTTEVVGPYSCSVNVASNQTNLDHSLLVTSSITLQGRSFTDSRITALKMPVSMFFYTLGINSSFSPSAGLTTGASNANGDVYVTGSLSLPNSAVINGDVEVTGSSSTGSATITGQNLSAVKQIAFPGETPANYQSVASNSLINLLLGVLISGETYTTPYMVVYTQGSTSISGSFNGKGVLFVNGNLTVTGNLAYLLSTDETAIIVNGNVTVNSGVTSIVGYWYVSGNFSTSKALTLTRGCLVANNINLGGALTATYDPTIWTTPGEATRLKLPGFWP